MYENGETVEIIGRLLGHASPASTVQYLGISQAKAQARALANDIFSKPKPKDLLHNSQLSEVDIDHLSQQIWERLASKLGQFLDETSEKGR